MSEPSVPFSQRWGVTLGTERLTKWEVEAISTCQCDHCTKTRSRSLALDLLDARQALSDREREVADLRQNNERLQTVLHHVDEERERWHTPDSQRSEEIVRLQVALSDRDARIKELTGLLETAREWLEPCEIDPATGRIGADFSCNKHPNALCQAIDALLAESPEPAK